jgi:hypothetical protein
VTALINLSVPAASSFGRWSRRLYGYCRYHGYMLWPDYGLSNDLVADTIAPDQRQWSIRWPSRRQPLITITLPAQAADVASRLAINEESEPATWSRQGTDLNAIIDLFAGQRRCLNPAGLRAQAEMQLPPGPAPFWCHAQSFSPVLSTSKWTGWASPSAAAGGGRDTTSVAERWLRVVCSGTRTARPSRLIIEPISPSASLREC